MSNFFNKLKLLLCYKLQRDSVESLSILIALKLNIDDELSNPENRANTIGEKLKAELDAKGRKQFMRDFFRQDISGIEDLTQQADILRFEANDSRGDSLSSPTKNEKIYAFIFFGIKKSQVIEKIGHSQFDSLFKPSMFSLKQVSVGGAVIDTIPREAALP